MIMFNNQGVFRRICLKSMSSINYYLCGKTQFIFSIILFFHMFQFLHWLNRIMIFEILWLIMIIYILQTKCMLYSRQHFDFFYKFTCLFYVGRKHNIICIIYQNNRYIAYFIIIIRKSVSKITDRLCF